MSGILTLKIRVKWHGNTKSTTESMHEKNTKNFSNTVYHATQGQKELSNYSVGQILIFKWNAFIFVVLVVPSLLLIATSFYSSLPAVLRVQ